MDGLSRKQAALLESTSSRRKTVMKMLVGDAYYELDGSLFLVPQSHPSFVGIRYGSMEARIWTNKSPDARENERFAFNVSSCGEVE